MSYAAELKQRYSEARKRLGLGVQAPVVVIRGKIDAKEQEMRSILPFIATLRPIEPTAPTYRDEEETFADYNPLTAKTIIMAAADAACVPVKELLGPRREYKLTAWRQVAMYLIVTLRPDLSYPSIGRAMGKDHSTIIHGHRKVSKNLPKYGKHLAAILDRVLAL